MQKIKLLALTAAVMLLPMSKSFNSLAAQGLPKQETTLTDKQNSPYAPQPGDKMPDGSIYVGISPDTEKPMYAAPADCALDLTFNRAAKHAKKLNKAYALGHKDWRVPTPAELNLLYKNRDKGALKGTFKYSPADDYLSSRHCYFFLAHVQRFYDGQQSNSDRFSPMHVRYVR